MPMPRVKRPLESTSMVAAWRASKVVSRVGPMTTLVINPMRRVAPAASANTDSGSSACDTTRSVTTTLEKGPRSARVTHSSINSPDAPMIRLGSPTAIRIFAPQRKAEVWFFKVAIDHDACQPDCGRCTVLDRQNSQVHVIFRSVTQPLINRLSHYSRKIRESFAHTPQALRLVYQANPSATLGLGILTLLGALLPATQAWVGKLIVDGVVSSIKAANDPQQVSRVFFYLALELMLFLIGTALNHSRRLIQQLIQLQIANRIRSEIIRKALTLDLAFFEHPDFYDRLQNARREGGYKPVELINDTFQIVQNIITMISFAVLMLRFSPWLVLILLATSIPSFIAETRFSEQGFRLLTRRAPETRQINYLARLLTEDTAAKEIKLFNLGETLLGRYMTLFDKFFQEDKSLAVRRAGVGFALGLVATLG